jgi:sensor histidine kinase YesM
MSSLRRATMAALAIVLAARVGVAFFAVEREGHERQAAESRAARARIRAITAQMNPHFLFNTLHSLSALLRRDVSAAESVLERLGRLLRYGLDRGDSPLPLADEWQFTESYLELEKVRLSSRLQFDAQFQGDSLDRMVPPFILQPLVENAIRHAIDANPEGGSVSIGARIRDDAFLVIEVRDSGAGDDDESVMNASGVGVRGVRAQLAAHCGDEAGFEIERPAGGGFVIRLVIPPIDE